MPAKYYKNILIGGVCLAFISLILVFENLLFPYITSKQIYFNILLEILGVIWIFFILQYPEARPKKSLVTYGIGAFFLALLISTIFSVDFNLSFWGDIERMLGWFHLAHFLLFYLIIITVFRRWKDWKLLFIAFTLISVIVSIVGIGQRYGIFNSPWGTDRVISTIGNAAYVGAFAIFSLYFIAILMLKEKNRLINALYAAAGLLAFIALIFSGTRGAYLGFGIGVIIFLLLYVFLGENKKAKKISGALIFLAIVSVVLIFAYKDAGLVKNSAFLRRITTSKLTDATLQTRLISWKTAAKDFPSHPILGTGYGNFAITFDKYFDPNFYNYTSSETYFDRAHNNLVDIASTAGGLGALTYLAVFAICFYLLIRGYRAGRLDLTQFGLLTTLIIAYFLQNLFVFDALATYIPLMILLAYIHWLAGGAPGEDREEEEDEWEEIIDLERQIKANGLAIGTVAGIVMLIVVYQYNIKPIEMLSATIDGQMEFSVNRDIIKATEAYKKALSYNTPLDRDSRNTFVVSLTKNSPLLFSLAPDKGEEIIKYGVELAEKNAKLNPADSMYELVLGQMYYLASAYFSNSDKFYYYSKLAEEAIDKAIASSPGRVPVYFERAQVFLSRGEIDKAIEVLQYAQKLNPKYAETYCHLSRIYYFKKDEAKAYELSGQCLDLGGVSSITSADYVKVLFAYYQPKNEWERMKNLMGRLAEMEPNNPQHWVDLAKIQLQLGDKESAKASAAKVGEIDPSLKSAALQFIKQIEAK
ncbi:MAG: O-antigen ligase family protein [Patescibacteria group bacterium]|jgi:putative inorganic carbon (HCO3(-)) transporter